MIQYFHIDVLYALVRSRQKQVDATGKHISQEICATSAMVVWHTIGWRCRHLVVNMGISVVHLKGNMEFSTLGKDSAFCCWLPWCCYSSVWPSFYTFLSFTVLGKCTSEVCMCL